MSDDPHALTPPESEPPAPPAAETPVETLPQKRRYKKGEPGASTSAEGSDEEIIVLSSLLQNLLARKQNEETSPVEAENRGKINRFVARNSPALGAPPLAAPLPALPVPEDPPSSAVLPPAQAAPARAATGLEGMAAIAFPKFEPRAFQPNAANADWQRTGSTWGRGILYFAFTAGLTLAGFLAGGYDAHKKDKTQPLPPPSTANYAAWSPEAAGQLGKALAVDRAGNLEGARQLVVELQKKRPDDNSLTTYVASIDTRLGRVNDVEAGMSRRLGPNTPPDASAFFYQAQGFNYTRRRAFDRAEECFVEVTRLRPFDAANFLHLAEARRRSGKLADAVDTFNEALLRLPVDAAHFEEREYAKFKQRLTQVELGREADLRVDLDQHLTGPAPGSYWLLTGAAVALQKGDMPAAVDLFKRIQAVVPPTQFADLLGDYFFRGFAYHAEMTPFLNTLSPEQSQARHLQMGYFIDP